MKVCFVLGGPGCGKGTVSKFITSTFPCYHISAGELLRKVKAGSPSYKAIEAHMLEGTIVPSAITCGLLNEIIEKLNHSKIVLIDGFPRNFENLTKWIDTMSESTVILKVLHVKCVENLMIERCLSRNDVGIPRRNDDEADIIKKRILQYKTEIMPVLDYFTKLKLVQEIDSNQPRIQMEKDADKYFRDISSNI